MLVTPSAIKDILFTGQETATANMISATKLKAIVVKGLWRYSYLNIGQYVKVDLEPPPPSFGGTANNGRPVILRIISATPSSSQAYRIIEGVTRVDVHLSYQSVDDPSALVETDLPTQVLELLDFREHDVHVQFMQQVQSSGGHAGNSA